MKTHMHKKHEICLWYMKKCSLTTGKLARKDKKGAVKQGQQEGASPVLHLSSESSEVSGCCSSPHSSSCCLLAISLEHEMKTELHCEDAISLLQRCRRHMCTCAPVQPWKFQPALQKAPLVMQLWQGRSSCVM